MIIHNMSQRSDEWNEIRAGKLTASVASKLVTPTGKPSVQYRNEIARIIAEAQGWQEPEEIKPTYWMDRGVDLEKEARAWFQVETGHSVHDIGFIESDDHIVGASPDGIVMLETRIDEQVLPIELKCPKPSTHIGWLLAGAEVPKEHIAQVHFQIAVCESDVGYFCSYHPECAPLILEVKRSEYTELMVEMIEKYKDEFKLAWKLITGDDYEVEM